MRSVEKLHTHLAQAGHSRTIVRDKVYLALDEIGPCTRRELAAHLQTQVDESSVYRTINLFLKLGVADMIRFHLLELSDRFKQHHHHFVCNSCGREVGFHDEVLEQLLSKLAASRRLTLTDHQVELSGLCSECAGS
jgi:Fur family ferric uptake transcriptional regulator